MARKKDRVPEVLWKLFRSRARTLADTILALIPTAAECRCRGRRCLSCSGGEAMSFLLRPGDPADYRKLLAGCFVVVSENAPPLPPVFDPHCRWPQHEIVRRSIEMIMQEEPSPSNLICSRYDRDNRSSDVVDTLTSSKWSFLLRRVGDAMMMYLLKYSSIFLPLPRKKFRQVAGFPISDLVCVFSRRRPDSKSQPCSNVHDGPMKKRKRVEEVKSILGKELSTYSLGSEPSFNPIRLSTSNGENKSPEEVQMPTQGSSCVSNEELTHNKYDGCLTQNTIPLKKRTRQYKWQRQRKRRQLSIQENRPLIPHEETSAITSHEDNLCDCICCSVFLNEPKMNQNAEIDRQNIFYKLENSTSMFPRKHILYTVKPNCSGASVLFNNIFTPFDIDKIHGTLQCLHSKDNCPVISTCLYHSLNKMLKSLIRETQNCRYQRLLDKHCPIGSSYQDTSMPTGTGFEGNKFGPINSRDGTQLDQAELSKNKMTQTNIDQVEPSTCYCPKKQVVSFIWAISRRIVPSPLLGEPSNWRILQKNISKFIHLRKFEKFSLKECIHKLKISKFPLFSKKSCGDSDTTRHAVLQCWIFWFFSCLVVPLVEANFYVTESEYGKQEILYFRKSTWEKLVIEANCVKDGMYLQLDNISAGKIIGNRSFGFSRARLRPKKSGFRMLTNLQAPSRMRMGPVSRLSFNRHKMTGNAIRNRRVNYKFFKSVNSVLHDLHVVLKGLCAKEPEKLGSSVFDYNGVYKKLVPFLSRLRNGSRGKVPGLFFVVSDVSKAFDSVNQDKLLSVMGDVVLDDVYNLDKSTQVVCTKKSLRVHHHMSLAHQDIVNGSARISPRLPAQKLDCVLVKKELSRNVTKDQINFILKEHITRNVVQLHNKFYLQNVGIPQGSVLSSLLCSLYYGHMETNVVYPFLAKATDDTLGESANPASLLLRFIDDFIFISTSKKQASMFFSRLARGVRDYNCCMNKEKYGLNFDLNSGQQCQSNRLCVGEDGVSYLSWSGLLVNCSTLEIQADYSRYLSSHLSSTLTVSCRGKVGHHLKSKLRCYLRPKCHPIFYDSNINSPGVVRLNIYQVFLLCAMKFICYIKNLSKILPSFSPRFYFTTIFSSLRYMNRLIKRRMHCFEVDAAFRPKYNVAKKDVIWLGLYAYSRALWRKQSRYKELIGLLRSELKAYGNVNGMSSELKYAVDDARSSVLWGIKY